MQKHWSGNAVATTLASPMNPSGDPTFSTLASDGWPTTGPFVVVVDRGTPSEEKILVASRSSNVYAIQARGHDGTSGLAHGAGATVEHGLDAETVAEANAHVNDSGRDDHTQYLTNERHTNPELHTIGSALPIPDPPQKVGTVSASGTSAAAARADHVHDIADGAIDHPELFVDDVIGAEAIHDAGTFVTGGGITKDPESGLFRINVDDTTLGLLFNILYLKDGSVTLAKLASGLRPVFVSATAPSSPSTGDLWYDTVNARLRVWNATASAWRFVYGKRIGAKISASTARSQTDANWRNLGTGGFNTEVYDPDDTHAASDSFVTIAEAGYYRVTVAGTWDNSSTGWRGVGFHIGTFVDGSQPSNALDLKPCPSNTHTFPQRGTEYINLAVGDKVTAVYLQESGGALNLTSCSLEVELVGYSD